MMEEPIDKTAVIMKRLQEREQEQILILSICKALSQALNKEELNAVVNGIIKDNLLFEDFILTSSHDGEKEYQIFYQSSNKNTGSKKYTHNDGFFNLCQDTADTVIFDLTGDKKDPDFIQNINKNGCKHAVGVCLPYLKGKRNILFLFFKNTRTFTREANRVLWGITMQLSITIRNIILNEEFENNIMELKKLKKAVSEHHLQTVDFKKEGFHGIIGKSEAMQEVYELISNVASSNATVLIFGETGTGKELAASAIHQLSLAAKNTMIKVNCASIPENLIESELFGHEKGAFTGAAEQRIGKFEQAANSTIFLDEIGELPLELQGKLLRVLQEKEIERIGGNKTIKVNARIIAATNKCLEKEVAENRFRKDLYYRLNVYPIQLPALRDRKEDIPVLGKFFLEKHAQKNGKKIKSFSKKVLNMMMANAWQGNVRELENMVERSILFAKEEVIKEMTFPGVFIVESGLSDNKFYIKTLQEAEKEHILKVVQKCNGRISGPQGAAVILGLPGTTLISRMKKLGIKKEHF